MSQGPTTHSPGVGSGLELALRFLRWADALSTPLTAEKIAKHWNVSRATSYRWLNAYNAAVGAE